MDGWRDQLLWSLWRRRRVARAVPGFWASPSSYASRDCCFAPHNRIYRHVFLRAVRLARMSYVAEGSRIGFCSIGAFSSIGPDSLVGGLGRHPLDRLSTHPAWYSRRGQAGQSYVGHDSVDELPATVIGNDVWIGARCVVLDGASIGDGAVIAAGAVVTRPVPPYAICAGIPARPLRFRFSDEVIAALLAWRWWDLDDSALRRLAGDFGAPQAWTPEHITTLRGRSAAPEDLLPNEARP